MMTKSEIIRLHGADRKVVVEDPFAYEGASEKTIAELVDYETILEPDFGIVFPDSCPTDIDIDPGADIVRLWMVVESDFKPDGTPVGDSWSHYYGSDERAARAQYKLLKSRAGTVNARNGENTPTRKGVLLLQAEVYAVNCQDPAFDPIGAFDSAIYAERYTGYSYAVVETETGLVYEDGMSEEAAEELIYRYLARDKEAGETMPKGYILRNTATGEEKLINC